MSEIVFKKTGEEVKRAANNKISALEERVGHRNFEIDKLLENKQKTRSYLVRAAFPEYNRGNDRNKIFGKNDISIEEVEEIRKICQRIYEIEAEISRLKLTVKHMDNKQEVYLTMNNLLEYGFDLEEI